MKRIAILGGGIYQTPMIRRAIEKGYRVSVASLSRDDPGMRLAHDPWVVNLLDHEAVCNLVRERKIDGVTTTGTEFSIPAIGYIHDRLGLPGVSMETAKTMTNKILAQTRFAEENVPAARFRYVTTLRQALAAAEEIGYPVYVKAPDSSGSRGIRMVPGPGDMEAAFAEAVEISKKGEILVEEMLKGVEFGAQVIVVDGEVLHCLCHNDTVTPPPVTVPVGHSLPFNESGEIRRQAREVCGAAVRALKIRNAVCNADLIATPDGVRLFEIGARIGATGLPEIVEIHHGINLYDVAISMALGERPEITPGKGPAAAYLLIRALRSGRLARCRIPDEVKRAEGVVEIHFDYPEGTEVREFRTGPDRIGHVLVTADDSSSAEELARRVVEALDIRIE